MDESARPKKDNDVDVKNRKKQRRNEEQCFLKTVDVSKVNMPVIKRWLEKTLDEQLPDDDVAVEFIYELLIGAENDEPNIGPIREQLNDFLGKEKSRVFCLDLWQLLLNAQTSPDGVPQKLVDKRKAEMENADRARKETDLILSQLRPKLSSAKKNIPIRKSDTSETKSQINPVVDGNKVSKPGRKTNYNRS